MFSDGVYYFENHQHQGAIINIKPMLIRSIKKWRQVDFSRCAVISS
ncbi:unnamed protein product [Acanthoscelides obtectus]|uniref:Uncharacterized protein n=1 Tax=Acanthoscelides obtectus TaxID=200917 RepID=A0A9P0PAX3_ACAOB|nr:unnamed protein product [Acanthoscelides obtectus]CAK1647307.1 hypothetical protein AOBTE_LOCUS15171 [Acanthoscelides obtectus]